ncbi:hypothetical protein SAMN06295905_3498 [Devosia lucknowensis]|uniref:Uncharacterized protein n=1 Tax=Devosia lucknowensis TaxID=1096929 RepID=A0A1Y6G7V8_9HYPH|nr:hypothetical protein [Devosia lucknowensis]SMQ86195.1 hypothetical protein SAMN06295905_3498 [Devosia lucknowensis]
MTRLGDAAVAMWWNVDEAYRVEFHEWHSKEHLPERLSIPGFRRGTRWQDGTHGAFFVLYELSDYGVLTSADYLARLNDPTPWSTKMMPLHRGMVRSQCRILAASGEGVARILRTVRLSPRPGEADRLRRNLEELVASVPGQEGLTSAMLLHTETPDAEPTAEQKIRGRDGAADWIVVIGGHDRAALDRVAGESTEARLIEAGAQNIEFNRYDLVHGLTALDMQRTVEEPA